MFTLLFSHTFPLLLSFFFFFFNDTATTEIYTLSLHDALPISCPRAMRWSASSTPICPSCAASCSWPARKADRKSTRLNSSHLVISYAVFCLKKKKNMKNQRTKLYLQYTNISIRTVPYDLYTIS